MSATNPYGSDAVNKAYSSGQSAIGSFDPNSWASSTGKGYTDLFGNQQNQQNDYIKAYKDTIAANPSATDLYNKANDMFNVPTLQSNANTLNNMVLQTPNRVLDTAKGFNYDNNQVQNQTALDLSRLSPLATAATNSANTASGLASNYVNAGLQQNQTNLLPVQQQGQMMSDLWARQTSGFTITAEQQLNGLISKMQSGVQLSQSELQAYAQLAAAEESYNSAIEQAKIGANAGITQTQLNNQYKMVPAGNTFINTFTGASQRAL